MTDRKAMREIELRQEHLQAFAFGRFGIEEEQTAFCRLPTVHIGSDE
jgi:hypothetical protein